MIAGIRPAASCSFPHFLLFLCTVICCRYAWVVVMAIFWINTLCSGYIKSFGITKLLLLEYFPNTSAAAAGLVMGLLIGSRGLLGE